MNQYFICNSSNFPEALEWAGRQARDDNVQLTAYCEAQSHQIMKNAADGPHEWDVPYHFARTAASVMRLGMLMATGLEPRFYNSDFTSVEENTRAFNRMPTNQHGQINEGDLLAANRNQTRLFFSYFDTMYTKHYIMALLLGQPEGEQRRNILRQMIVVSPNYNVIWQITSTLYIVSNGQRVLNAKPFIAVWRYDRVEGNNVPLNITPHDDDDGDKEDLDFENVVECIKNMCLKK